MVALSPRGTIRAFQTLPCIFSVLLPCKSLVTFCTDTEYQQHLSLLHHEQDSSLLAHWKLKLPGLLAPHDGPGRLPCPRSWQRQMAGSVVSYFCSSATAGAPCVASAWKGQSQLCSVLRSSLLPAPLCAPPFCHTFCNGLY